MAPKLDKETKAYLKATASRLVYLAPLCPDLLEIAQRLDDASNGKKQGTLSLAQLQMVHDRINGD